MGINNSLFNNPQPYNIGLANDVTYIGSGQDMHIANSNNKTSIVFSTGTASTPYFAEKMRLTNAGTLAIGTTGANAVDTVNAKLHVVGKVKIVDGNQATGKVLTSDANGLATWQTGVTTLTTKAASYTISNTDNFIIYTTLGITGQTFTLPTAAAAGTGKEFTIKNMSGFGLTVSSTSSLMQEYISTGVYPTSVSLGTDASNNWIKVISDGTNWIVFRALF
jgi:hypothetical protein